jgi:hypothetical protein
MDRKHIDPPDRPVNVVNLDGTEYSYEEGRGHPRVSLPVIPELRRYLAAGMTQQDMRSTDPTLTEPQRDAAAGAAGALNAVLNYLNELTKGTN